MSTPKHPADWKDLADALKAHFDHHCAACGTSNPALTAVHLDRDHMGHDDARLGVLCDPCAQEHYRVQTARLFIDSVDPSWDVLPNIEWDLPHLRVCDIRDTYLARPEPRTGAGP
jgi:hypothetical protein